MLAGSIAVTLHWALTVSNLASDAVTSPEIECVSEPLDDSDDDADPTTIPAIPSAVIVASTVVHIASFNAHVKYGRSVTTPNILSEIRNAVGCLE